MHRLLSYNTAKNERKPAMNLPAILVDVQHELVRLNAGFRATRAQKNEQFQCGAAPYGRFGHVLWRGRPEGMEEMTVPLDIRNDIRSMDAEEVPRTEIARRIRLSHNTVARYADMSPEPPVPARRPRPAIDPHAGWIDGLLEADLRALRKQRH